MAIVQNPITGRMTGNISGTKFAKNLGRNIAASIPLKKSLKPQALSTAVILNRAKLSLIGSCLKKISSNINIIYPKRLKRTSEFSELNKFFLKVLTGPANNLILDLPKIITQRLGNGYLTDYVFYCSNSSIGYFEITCMNPTIHDAIFNTIAQVWLLIFAKNMTNATLFPIGRIMDMGVMGIDLTSRYQSGDEVIFYIGILQPDPNYNQGPLISKFYPNPNQTFTTLV